MADLPPLVEEFPLAEAGVYRSRAEGLRSLIRELRRCRAIADYHKVDHDWVVTLVDAAIHGAEKDLRAEDARRLRSPSFEIQ